MGLGHGSYCFALLRSIPAVFYVVLVTGLRYHLFIWSVFSPKLLYEAMHTLITTAVCLFFTFMDQERSARPWIQRQDQSQTQVQKKRCNWVLCTKRRNERKSDGRRFSVILLLWMRSMLRIQSMEIWLAPLTFTHLCVWLNYLYIFWGVFNSADNVWEDLWAYIWKSLSISMQFSSKSFTDNGEFNSFCILQFPFLTVASPLE